MELRDALPGGNRAVNVLLAVVFALVSIRSLRNGQRLRGALAGAGAVAFGAGATKSRASESDDGSEYEIGADSAGSTGTEPETVTETASEEQAATHGLTCASCGDPIRPGQRRGPNENGVIVHDDCA
ncbi:DUF2892 domain-containing protein [Halorientalis brevis]|uniref:DUF2892 domain-containing protein n=1 Tax=Halorientalis brevis TaxID=1126241 RepID=A0ABD6CII4_9EURY|nr:DUF2892 domain-containing protein [Halorientalis brevis]